MVVEKFNDHGEVCSIIFLNARNDYRDLYLSHHKIYGVKMSHSSNFNPISITLWYENSISFKSIFSFIFFILPILAQTLKYSPVLGTEVE